MLAAHAAQAVNVDIDIRGPNPERSPVLTRFFRHWPKPPALADGTQPNGPGLCGIEGPTGSGKTRTLFTKAWRLAQRMPVSPANGLRNFKIISLATTYRQLWRGPIPSLLEVLPKRLGNWHGSPPDSPASHEIYARCADGGVLHYLHEFVAIGEKYASEEELETIFRGWPATVFHLVEADTLPAIALDFALDRSGRYPAKIHGEPPWYGVLFDLNAPRQTSWIYTKMRREWKEGLQFFRQPPAVLRDGMGGWVVNPHAENQENLRDGHYQGRIDPANPGRLGERMIRRMLGGEHMPDMRGKPVYGFFLDTETGKQEGHFDANRHVAKQVIAPIPGIKLYFGTDGGRMPGGGFFQIDPRTDQVRLLAEILASHGTGEKRYAEAIKRILAGEPFNNLWKPEDIEAGADPSCFFGKDEKEGKGDWAFAFEAESRIRLRPGGGIANARAPRIEIIANLLAAPDVAPGVPKLIVSPNCVLTIEAMEGGYRYAQMRINSEKPKFDDEPEKNDLANLMEGWQYGLLRALGSDAAWGRYGKREPSGARPAITENNEDGRFYANPRALRGNGARPQRTD